MLENIINPCLVTFHVATKNPKEFLLKSGIPLEASVLKALSDYGFRDYGEIEYSRDGVIFTTDRDLSTSTHIRSALGLHIDYILECKYKSRNHVWYFFKFYKNKEEEYLSHEEEHNLTTLGLFESYLESQGFPFSNLWFCVKDLEIENIFSLPEVHKGIDVCEGGGEEKSIHEAVSQVTFASIKAHIESISYTMDMLKNLISGHELMTGKELTPVEEEIEGDYVETFELEHEVEPGDPRSELVDLASLTIPIIITTAELRLIEDNITLEQIEVCEDVKAISREVPGVCLYNNYPEKYTEFSKECIKKSLKRDPIDDLDDSFEAWYDKLPERLQFLDTVRVRALPGRIYVINYKQFERTFREGHEKIVQMANQIEKME